MYNAEGVGSAVNHLQFCKTPVKGVYDTTGVIDQTSSHGEVSHNGANTTALEAKSMGWDAIVSQDGQVVWCDVF
jgi:hypothetical protein